MKRSVALALVAAFSSAGRGRASAQTATPLRAIGSPNDGFKAMYYGVRSGIFAKYGLAVDIVSVNNGSAAAAALIGGDADVAMANILTLIQAHRKGIAMTMLAPNYLDTSDKPTVAALVLKDSPLHGGHDLDGKTIAVPGIGDVISVGTKTWIDKSGGDAKSIHFLEVPMSSAVASLEQGRVDVVATIEPFVSLAMATGKVRVLGLPMASLGSRLQLGSFIVMEPNVTRKLDAMSRLARALHESSLYTSSHFAETVDLVASYSGVAPDAIAKMNREVDPEYCDVRLIQPVIDALAKYGGIDQGFPATDIISSAALKPPR
jgi:NitT/TauT family transport system substrate-binding protein